MQKSISTFIPYLTKELYRNHFIKKNALYHSTLVISIVFTNSDQNSLLVTNLLNFLDQNFLTHKKTSFSFPIQTGNHLFHRNFYNFNKFLLTNQNCSIIGLSSIKNAFLYDLEIYDFKTFFRPSFNIQKTNYNLRNKYFIYKVNQCPTMNGKYYNLQEFIWIDFVKFEIEYFNQLDNTILQVFRNNYYPYYRFWINLNLSLNKTYNTAMLEAVAAKQNNKQSLKQIEQIEKHYYSLSKTTWKCK